MADNSFSGIVGSMMKGMEGFLSSKTVVGEPTQIGDTTIIPLVDVTFGVGAGASTKDNKNGGGGGMSGKMTPSAVLVIKNGQIKLVNVKNQDTMTKILDMVPDIVDKVADIAGGKKNKKDEAVDEAINDITGNDNK